MQWSHVGRSSLILNKRMKTFMYNNLTFSLFQRGVEIHLLRSLWCLVKCAVFQEISKQTENSWFHMPHAFFKSCKKHYLKVSAQWWRRATLLWFQKQIRTFCGDNYWSWTFISAYSPNCPKYHLAMQNLGCDVGITVKQTFCTSSKRKRFFLLCAISVIFCGSLLTQMT